MASRNYITPDFAAIAHMEVDVPNVGVVELGPTLQAEVTAQIERERASMRLKPARVLERVGRIMRNRKRSGNEAAAMALARRPHQRKPQDMPRPLKAVSSKGITVLYPSVALARIDAPVASTASAAP